MRCVRCGWPQSRRRLGRLAKRQGKWKGSLRPERRRRLCSWSMSFRRGQLEFVIVIVARFQVSASIALVLPPMGVRSFGRCLLLVFLQNTATKDFLFVDSNDWLHCILDPIRSLTTDRAIANPQICKDLQAPVMGWGLCRQISACKALPTSTLFQGIAAVFLDYCDFSSFKNVCLSIHGNSIAQNS